MTRLRRANFPRTSAPERRARVGVVIAAKHGAAGGVVVGAEYAGTGVRVGAEA